jgi:hypothetical protein
MYFFKSDYNKGINSNIDLFPDWSILYNYFPNYILNYIHLNDLLDSLFLL